MWKAKGKRSSQTFPITPTCNNYHRLMLLCCTSELKDSLPTPRKFELLGVGKPPHGELGSPVLEGDIVTVDDFPPRQRNDLPGNCSGIIGRTIGSPASGSEMPGLLVVGILLLVVFRPNLSSLDHAALNPPLTRPPLEPLTGTKRSSTAHGLRILAGRGRRVRSCPADLDETKGPSWVSQVTRTGTLEIRHRDTAPKCK